MIKRSSEEIQIITEEDLLESFCTLEVLKDGKDSYRFAIVKFLNVTKNELEKLVKKLHNYKITDWNGLIKFCFEKPIMAIKSLIKMIQNWILPFIDALGSGEEWSNNFKLLESLHSIMADRIDDLSKTVLMENRMSKTDKSFIKSKIEAHEQLCVINTESRPNRLSLKKKLKK